MSSTQQTYFNLAQDEANALMERQGDVTRMMSGYALLIAIPTIAFSLYSTNLDHPAGTSMEGGAARLYTRMGTNVKHPHERARSTSANLIEIPNWVMIARTVGHGEGRSKRSGPHLLLRSP